MDQQYTELHFICHFSSSSVLNRSTNEEMHRHVFLGYLVTLGVRNMKSWPTTCFRLLGGRMKNGWTNSTQTVKVPRSVYNWFNAISTWLLNENSIPAMLFHCVTKMKIEN